jgi:hypothetical protein
MGLNIRFIVTGHGRSGTMWLARLLNADGTVNVHHEPLGNYDAANYWRVRAGLLDGVEFIRERKPLMEKIWECEPQQDYAEVNSYLRYCVPALREAFGTHIAAIIRDGRYVVRSMMARGVYQRPGYPPIETPEDIVDPFAKCCWYWADTYRILLDGDVPIFCLEHLNNDYGCFSSMCDRLGITVEKSIWEKYVQRRINSTTDYEEPLHWSTERKQTFNAMAGHVFSRFYAYDPCGIEVLTQKRKGKERKRPVSSLISSVTACIRRSRT